MRNFLLGCFVASAVWLAYYSSAQDALVVSGLAIHLDGGHHCNSVTEGLGWEHSQSENYRSQVGFYRNSNCRWSAYIAEAWLPLHVGNWRSGLIAGAVTGYRATITPVAGFVSAYQITRHWGINAVTIPPSGESGKGVVWFQAAYTW